MYDKLIENYINKLEKKDIIKFASINNIVLNEEEVDIFYNYIKKYWKIVYKDDPTPIFNDLKNKLEKSTYNNMISLYKKYKKRLKF